jgi:hypothetical protein
MSTQFKVYEQAKQWNPVTQGIDLTFISIHLTSGEAIAEIDRLNKETGKTFVLRIGGNNEDLARRIAES